MAFFAAVRFFRRRRRRTSALAENADDAAVRRSLFLCFGFVTRTFTADIDRLVNEVETTNTTRLPKFNGHFRRSSMQSPPRSSPSRHHGGVHGSRNLVGRMWHAAQTTSGQYFFHLISVRVPRTSSGENATQPKRSGQDCYRVPPGGVAEEKVDRRRKAGPAAVAATGPTEEPPSGDVTTKLWSRGDRTGSGSIRWIASPAKPRSGCAARNDRLAVARPMEPEIGDRTGARRGEKSEDLPARRTGHRERGGETRVETV